MSAVDLLEARQKLRSVAFTKRAQVRAKLDRAKRANREDKIKVAEAEEQLCEYFLRLIDRST